MLNHSGLGSFNIKHLISQIGQVLLVGGLDRLVSKALVNLLHKLRPPLYTDISLQIYSFLIFGSFCFPKRALITVCIIIPLYYKK